MGLNAFLVKTDYLKQKAHSLPEEPGVYQFLDDQGRIIYVGKAKNLRRRVLSYFNRTIDDPKTRILVRHIHDIKHMVVETEMDALLLENSLIKKYKPRYNIQLKDDKSYPWIVLENEHFPRVFYTRNVVKDGSLYFGPYTSVSLVRTMLAMFRDVFKLRTCNLDLSPYKIKQGKYKPCLEYHIKNCMAPCIGLQSHEEYMHNIEQIKKILSGKTREVIAYFKKQMLQYAENLEFEKAQEIKEHIEQLENYQSRSTVVNPNLKDLEVYSILDEEKIAFVNYMKVVEGKVIQFLSTHVNKKLNESPQEILVHFILNIRENKQSGISNAQEILVPFEIGLHIPGIEIKVPKIGDKKKLLDLSLKNLEYYKHDYYKNKEATDPNYRALKLLEQVKNDLQAKNLPIHIECFDNSNLQGTNPVSSCVVFKYGKPSKKDYRRFSIKSVEGPDDYKTMEEVIYRRYKRLLEEKADLPDLIVIDGGKGQLSAALKSLKKLGIHNQVDIISIAKRFEEIYKPNDIYPLYISRNSYTLKLIQQIRDEAHRFGIEYHRQKRQKQMLSSEILSLKGIGLKTYEKLIDYFGSIEKIKNASVEELKKILDSQKAQIIYNHFHPLNKNADETN